MHIGRQPIVYTPGQHFENKFADDWTKFKKNYSRDRKPEIKIIHEPEILNKSLRIRRFRVRDLLGCVVPQAVPFGVAIDTLIFNKFNKLAGETPSFTDESRKTEKSLQSL